MNEFDPFSGEESLPQRFTVKEKCINHHACECRTKKLHDAEEFFRSQTDSIRVAQAAYEKAAADLISLYRTMSKITRPVIKTKLYDLYEKLKDLGVAVGVSRMIMSGIADG